MGFWKGMPEPRFFSHKFSASYFFKKRPEIVPILAIVALVAVNLSWFCVYMATTRPDVTFFNDPKRKPWDRIDLNNPKVHKLIRINQVYEPLPELARIYQDLDEEERRQQRERKRAKQG